MKRLIKSLLAWAVLHPGPVIAGALTLLGVGGLSVGSLITPSITPHPSAAFSPSQVLVHTSNNVLRPNAGTTGAEQFPATTSASFFLTVDGSVNPAFSSTYEYALGSSTGGMGLLLNGTGTGAPVFQTQKNGIAGSTGIWWTAISPIAFGTAPGVGSTPANYLNGYLPWTATGGGCAREPSGIVGPTTGGSTGAALADPGFQCSTQPTAPSFTTFANNGAQQAATITGCTSNTPSGEAQVTVTVPIAHGIQPAVVPSGTGITMAGFSSSAASFNQTNYVATQGTTGTTLVLESPLGASGVCPGGVSYPATGGTVLSGTGGQVNLSAISTTNPFGTNETTGITAKPGAKFCGVVGEYGSDSPTPGFQFAAFSDWNGTALTNSPVVSTWPNQGATNFTGYTIANTQSPSSPALTVTAMNPYSISAASFSTSTGYATFTATASPGFVPGSEFTVSGATTSGGGTFNTTYLAVAGTSGTTIIGNPLAAPLGMPATTSLTNSSTASTGSMVGVIVPGMAVFGATGSANVILPYGTFGGTGTGGAGTYGLSSNQIATDTFTVSGITTGGVMTVNGTPTGSLQLAIGEAIQGTGITVGTVITGYGTGVGGTGTYNVSPAPGSAVGAITVTALGTLGSSGTPVSLFAWNQFYYTAAATPSSSTTIGVLANRSATTIGDFFSYIAGYNALLPAQFNGWGGSLANIGDFYGIFPSTSNAPSQTALASICQKTTDYQSFATANSLTVHSLYRLSDTGIWGDSSVGQFTGSITGASGTSGGTATLNMSASINGASSIASMPASTVISGIGIAGCPAACPTLTTPSTGVITFAAGVTSANVSSETMAAGAWKPATPAAENGFNGYVSGNTLTVTSVASASKAVFTATTTLPQNSFTGHIDNGTTTGTTGNVLTVTTAPVAPYANTVLAGVQISWAGAPSPNPYVIADESGSGGTGTYALDQSISGGVAAGTTFTGTVVNMLAGESQIVVPNLLVVSAITSGTITTGMLVSDNATHITGQPLYIVSQQSGTTGGVGTYVLAPHYYPAIGTGETMDGVSTMLVPGQYLRDDATHTVTTPIKIVGLGTGANAPGVCSTGEWGCGVYTILNPGGLTIGSSGSPVAFTASGATDGQAIAPGPALTIKDTGPGVAFPVTNYGAGTGALYLSGDYNTGSLGGTPSAIQAQVSLTSGGPPISGCSACAWTNLSSATISGGHWSGQALNIPAGGPYFVAVRAANGTAYATLQSTIKVGLVLDVTGVGNTQPIFSTPQGGWAYSTYPGLWGSNVGNGGTFYLYDTGPSVLGPDLFPEYTQMIGSDQLGISGGSGSALAEPARDLGANLQNVMGYPVTFSNWTRDGAGIGLFSWGGMTQSQTVGLGTGSLATFCSSTVFCASAGVTSAGTLDWNLASLTGGLFTASISGTTLTVSGITTGALEPGAVLSDSFTGGGGHITGSPTLVNCTANCGGIGSTTSVWTISSSQGTIASETMRADPAGGAAAPFYNPQANWGGTLVTQKGDQVIKAGTFSVSVNGSVVCTDSNTFPVYNIMAGNCTGGGISSSFVNYVTGDYQITFSSAPANGAVITASWVENVSPSDAGIINVTNQLDYVGTGPETTGVVSSVFAKTPGGTSAHIMGNCITDDTTMWETGFPTGAVGWSQMIDWLYGTKLPGIFTGVGSTPYVNPATPLVVACSWRGDGLPSYQSVTSEMSYNSLADAWAIGLTTNSTFSGTIASNVLTLTASATGSMWEGEVIGCATFSLTCAVTPGTYITSLASGTWGASGSTYNLGGSPANVASATAMANELYYTAGQPIYAGGLNDHAVLPGSSGVTGSDGYSPHPTFGLASSSRVARKWSADIYGGLTGNAARPTLDRVKADAGGCDTSALADPCFDVGNTYAASHSATLVSASATITVTGGISANARPFVVGQALSCAGCTAGRFITAIDVPPTQSTTAGAGEVGQTFHITANGTMGVSTTETVTAGCSGTAGVGSNCIDIAFSINTPGTYGTAAALATCGENNLNGTAPPFTVPSGTCSSNGIGSLVHNFRIGSTQVMWGGVTPGQLGQPGAVYDDGVDPFTTTTTGGGFNQSAAFTCNIVAAKVVQCVLGALYTSGVPSLNKWSSGSTFVEYGDTTVGTGRGNSLVGNVGGQPFAFTAGSGYTPGTYTIPASNCVTSTGATWFNPQVDITVGAGGSIIDVYGSSAVKAIGFAIGDGCQFNFNSAITASITGSGGSAILNVTGLTSGGLAHGQTLTGASVNAGTTLNLCTSGCAGNPVVSPAIPTNTTAQTWSLTGYTGTAVSSESMTTALAAMGAGTGGAIATPPNKPTDGVYGLTDYNYSAILMGDELYDNSGFVGNPMHSFFDNGMGGYFEPGLAVRPFGLFMAAAVSG